MRRAERWGESDAWASRGRRRRRVANQGCHPGRARCCGRSRSIVAPRGEAWPIAEDLDGPCRRVGDDIDLPVAATRPGTSARADPDADHWRGSTRWAGAAADRSRRCLGRGTRLAIATAETDPGGEASGWGAGRGACRYSETPCRIGERTPFALTRQQRGSALRPGSEIRYQGRLRMPHGNRRNGPGSFTLRLRGAHAEPTSKSMRRQPNRPIQRRRPHPGASR